MLRYGMLLLLSLLSVGCATGSLKDRIVRAAGADQFGRIEELRLTVNETRGEAREAIREWIWRPDGGQVTLVREVNGARESIVYKRSLVTPESPQKYIDADKQFLSDTFQLLMPVHLNWSREATVADGGDAIAPIGGDSARLAIVKYPAQGDKPGDVYDLYLDSAYRIREWRLRPGGGAETKVSMALGPHEYFGPLWISPEHRRGDGVTLRVTAVSIEQHNGLSDDWRKQDLCPTGRAWLW
jgi:hypothetical protein